MEDVYLPFSVADKNLTNVGLDVNFNLSVNDQTRPGRARVPTAPFQAILGIETSKASFECTYVAQAGITCTCMSHLS